MDRRNFIKTAGVGVCGTVMGGCSSAASRSQMDVLSEHKIAGVRTVSVGLYYPRLVGKNSTKNVHGRGGKRNVYVITTDKGALGWGHSQKNPVNTKQAIEGMIGRPVSEFIDPARGILTPQVNFADIALHDLAGVILDKPVYEMLGFSGKLANPCYSGMIYFDDLEPPEAPSGIDKVMANCQYDYDLGYRQLKVKIGRGNKWMPKEQGLKRDIRITKLIARSFPDCRVLVDGNNGFSAEQFLRFMDGIENVKLFWIEEPFQESRKDLELLKAYLNNNCPDTLIAEGEAGFDRDFLMDLAKDGLVDVFLPDICGYGFSNWRKLMPQLIDRAIPTSPHTWGNALKSNYTAHLAAGMGNVLTIEGVTCSSADVDLSGYELADGLLTCPDGPGFGMQLLNL